LATAFGKPDLDHPSPEQPLARSGGRGAWDLV